MKTKRICILCLSSLAGCGSAETAETAADTIAMEATAETETEDPVAGRTLQDEVPELDFGGAEFRSKVIAFFYED